MPRLFPDDRTPEGGVGFDAVDDNHLVGRISLLVGVDRKAARQPSHLHHVMEERIGASTELSVMTNCFNISICPSAVAPPWLPMGKG